LKEIKEADEKIGNVCIESWSEMMTYVFNKK
jgi:hypothetical protein